DSCPGHTRNPVTFLPRPDSCPGHTRNPVTFLPRPDSCPGHTRNPVTFLPASHARRSPHQAHANNRRQVSGPG
ncbi:hypothetical protein, partial [Streptomyces sp. NPDC088360]|uniref:hypothetical protein n=1 Tax=Streptomyces sp. NPDC088360 TaxID=3154515 RepID=UPI00344E0C93